MKDIEVELKFPLLNPQVVIKRLNQIAKLKKKAEYQKDSYFIPKHRNFIKKKPISEWLRLRETNSGASFNYKNWHEATWCDEYETEISDIKSLEKILKALDFTEIIVVEKVRTSWQYKKVEVSIDKVTTLGTFIELEAKGKFLDVDQARLYLEKTLVEIKAKVGEQDFLGYPFHMLKRKPIDLK